MKRSQFRCLYAAAFLGFSPYNLHTPLQLLEGAKQKVSIDDKIAALREIIHTYPSDEAAPIARHQLVELLAGSNRMNEALEEYRINGSGAASPEALDFTLLEYLLKSGHYQELLDSTAGPMNPSLDPLRDQRLLQLRIQAFLANGHFRDARQTAENWLTRYGSGAIEGTRVGMDARSIRYLNKHLQALERLNGPEGKRIFTASVPESFQRWSHRRDVPVVFYKLIPAHPAGQLFQAVLPGRHEVDSYFESQVANLNRGFEYLSQGQFSLKYAGMRTLYVRDGDFDSTSTGGLLLTSRVYAHTIPEIYRQTGDALIVLVDYREQTQGEAAYVGDGIVHISASKLEPLIVIHEMLHALGATHQDWQALQREGHQFDPFDRGIMTFEHGEILDLGLEEKNRMLLGWPEVAVVRFGHTDVASAGVPDQTLSSEPLATPQTPPESRPTIVADGFIHKI